MSDKPPEDAWAPLVERFVNGHYGSLRGRVRTHVIHEHLCQHLGKPPQRAVDIGGGAGNQSIPLARDGHEVTIVDPSPAMLERARVRLAAETQQIASRVQPVEASGEDAPEVLGPGAFDAVLCHGSSRTSTTRSRWSTRSADSSHRVASCRSWPRTSR